MKKIRPYLLAENNWKNLKKRPPDLVILPWGATEAHNYHLPYGTDNFEADYIAAEAARKASEQTQGICVLPTLPFGVNTGQTDILLDINLHPSTQLAILSDILEVLNRQGIRKFMVLNSHGGNDFKTLLRELGVRYAKMFLCTANWFHALDKSNYFEHTGDHADEMETSIMLSIQPHLVLPKKDWGEGRERKIKIPSFSEKWAWTERKWSSATIDTGVGNPHASTAEKGAKYLNDLTDTLAKLMIEICEADPDNLYHS